MAWRARTRVRPLLQKSSPWERAELEVRPRWDLRLIIFLIVVLVLVGVSFFLFPGSSDLRWAALVWVLVVAGLVVFFSLYRTGVKVPPLEAPPEEKYAFKGELTRLAAILRRADRGLRYSQVAVALRVRAAFLTRIRSERGMTEEELSALQDSREDMARVVADPLIQAFLEDTALHEEALILQHAPRKAPAFRFAIGEDFTQGLGHVLEAMEAWR